MSLRSKTFHKSTFDRIKPDKREFILNTAAGEFAAQGYNAASINQVARKCGISIGSMYSYFDSKEALFMTIVEFSREILFEALNEIKDTPGDVYDKLTRMVEIAQTLTPRYRELNQIYIELSTQGLSHLSSQLSMEMESYTASIYREIFGQARKEGLMDPELDEGVVSFCIDNIITMTQFSYASDYYNDRMKIYAGEKIVEEPSRLANQIIRFIRNGLSG